MTVIREGEWAVVCRREGSEREKDSSQRREEYRLECVKGEYDEK